MENQELKAYCASDRTSIKISEHLRKSRKNARYYIGSDGMKMMGTGHGASEVIDGLRFLKDKEVVLTGKCILFYENI